MIVSITPACAAEISGERNSTGDVQTNMDTLTNSIDKDTVELKTVSSELKTHTDNINNCLNYIKGNWYKFWKMGNCCKEGC